MIVSFNDLLYFCFCQRLFDRHSTKSDHSFVDYFPEISKWIRLLPSLNFLSIYPVGVVCDLKQDRSTRNQKWSNNPRQMEHSGAPLSLSAPVLSCLLFLLPQSDVALRLSRKSAAMFFIYIISLLLFGLLFKITFRAFLSLLLIIIGVVFIWKIGTS